VFSFSADEFYHGAFRDAVFSSNLLGEDLFLMDKARGELGADVKTLGELCQRHGIGIITKDIFIEHCISFRYI
jgi:hypothetical protein